ncbi:MAG: hypothetical protein HKN92_12615 [Chitinophagales bacterium]|nr:hypothetical protein [Chitinophagales bacterium]
MNFLKYFITLSFSILIISGIVAQEDPIAQKSSELNQWMIDNFALSEKQIASVKEINYEIAKAVVESGSGQELDLVLQEQLSKVLSSDQVDRIKEELQVLD